MKWIVFLVAIGFMTSSYSDPIEMYMIGAQVIVKVNRDTTQTAKAVTIVDLPQNQNGVLRKAMYMLGYPTIFLESSDQKNDEWNIVSPARDSKAADSDTLKVWFEEFEGKVQFAPTKHQLKRLNMQMDYDRVDSDHNRTRFRIIGEGAQLYIRELFKNKGSGTRGVSVTPDG